MYLSAWASSRRGGCMFWPVQRPGPTATRLLPTKRSSPLMPRRSVPETSLESASTPATPTADTKSGRMVRRRGGVPIFGGIHASLYPDEPLQFGAAAAVVRGDGDLVWASVLSDSAQGKTKPLYEGGADRCGAFCLGPLGSDAARRPTCGLPCKPFAAARSTARSALSGGPMASCPASAPSATVIDEVVALRRRDIALSPWPTTIFIPSASTT